MSILQTTELIKRMVPGHYEDGSWVKEEPIDTVFWGTAQPATGKALQLLPEGKRSSENIQVFAPMEDANNNPLEFTSADSEKKVSGDIIIWEGRCYEIKAAKKWKLQVLDEMDHWELVAERVKEGEK
jgi:hypothetical protein